MAEAMLVSLLNGALTSVRSLIKLPACLNLEIRVIFRLKILTSFKVRTHLDRTTATMTSTLDERTDDVIVPEVKDVTELDRTGADAVDARNGQCKLVITEMDCFV